MAHGRNNLATIKLNPLENFGSDKLSHEQLQQSAANAAARKRQRDALKALRPTILMLPVGLQHYVADRYRAKYSASSKHAKRQAKYLLLCHLVWSKQKQAGTDDAVHLHSDILRKQIGKDKGFSYTDVVEDLKEWLVLTVEDSYSNGHIVDPYSKAYYFADSFHDLESEFITVSGLRYREKAAKDRQARQVEKNHREGLPVVLVDETQPHIQWLKASWERCEYAASTDELINEMERKQTALRDIVVKVNGVKELRTGRRMTAQIAQSYRDTLELFRRNKANQTPEWHFSATNGRLHTFFNRFFTASRNYVTVDGQPVTWADLDLAASQVYFLLKKLYATEAGRRGGADLDAFRDLVLAERFYQNLADLLQERSPLLLINNAKTDFFTHVNYSKTHHATPYRAVFNQLFPTVHAALLEIVCYRVGVETKFRNLAVLLQQEESAVFLQTICPRIYRELGHHEDLVVLPVHDGLCVPQQYKEAVHSIMVEELVAWTGYPPTVRTTKEKDAFKKAKKEAPNSAEPAALALKHEALVVVVPPTPEPTLATPIQFVVASTIDRPPTEDMRSAAYLDWLISPLFVDPDLEPPAPTVQEPQPIYA